MSTYSRGSEDSRLPQDGRDSGPFPSVKSTGSVRKSSKNIGPMSQYLETFTVSNGPEEAQAFLPGDFPASLFPLPGSARAKKMTVRSGLKCEGLLRNQGPVGLLLKMLLESSEWASTRCYLTWATMTTPQRRLLFRLVPWMPFTPAPGFGLWPTPNATAFKGGRLCGRVGKPIPEMNNWQDFCSLVLGQRYPSPELTESIMGFPAKWTEIDPSGTRSSRKSRTKSSVPSRKSKGATP